MLKVLLALVFLLVPACSHNDGVAPSDMAMASPPDFSVPLSQCGHPGDKGNSLGVGKFCTRISDCFGDTMTTNICSSLGNGGTPSADDTYFCTVYPCHGPNDGGASNCGEDATCVCGSGGGMSGCACTPNACLGGPPPADGGIPQPDASAPRDLGP